MFNQQYIAHLEDEIKHWKGMYQNLLNRHNELIDTRIYNRVPERLVKEAPPPEKKPFENYQTSQPSDALSVAEETAFKESLEREGKTVEEVEG